MTHRVINGEEYELCYSPDMPAEVLVEIRAGRKIVINQNFQTPISDFCMNGYILDCILMAIAAVAHPTDSQKAFLNFIELREIVEEEDNENNNQDSLFDWIQDIQDQLPL